MGKDPSSSTDPKPRLSPLTQADDGEHELLNLYLSLPRRERNALFAGTARSVEMAGLCQRTIQSWIETGEICAVCVGEKYQIHLPSLEQYIAGRTAGEQPDRERNSRTWRSSRD